MIPNPFIYDHINAHGRSGINQTLSEVPKYAVVDLADGSDGETRHSPGRAQRGVNYSRVPIKDSAEESGSPRA